MWRREGAENESDEITDGYDARARPEVRGQSGGYVEARSPAYRFSLMEVEGKITGQSRIPLSSSPERRTGF